MSVSTSIKDTLIGKINALDSVQSVYGYERNNFEGFPAVTVTASDLDGEFTSTTENSRNYAYKITILYSIGQALPAVTNLPINEQAENVISTVVDDIINDIDSDYELPDNTDVLFVNAADATWGFVDYEGGVAKACQITYIIRTDYNVT